jgi:regulatory protein
MSRLTRLQELPRDRVALELDGRPWRVVPATAVVRTALRVGEELDRERLRLFRKELRRAEALDLAARTLDRRDAPRAEVAARLHARGVLPAAREEALDRLTDIGALDDSRFAHARAQQLAGRGYGDEAIRYDLRQRGVPEEAVADAWGALEPEHARARRIVEQRGTGDRTAAFLARRGFEPDHVELALEGGC